MEEENLNEDLQTTAESKEEEVVEEANEAQPSQALSSDLSDIPVAQALGAQGSLVGER